MEFGRRIGLPQPKNAPSGDPKSEVAEHEIRKWEEAFLGKSLFQQDEYAVLLVLRSDPSKRLYGSLVVDPRRVLIDIPLVDHTPEEALARQVYETTFFGEVDPEKYRATATKEFTREHLLAFLNRKAAGVFPGETPDWFYTTFGVKHLEPYGSLYIGSHGGQGTYGYDYNATIESRRRAGEVAGKSVISAIDFAQTTQRSLPHIRVTPFPVDGYLQEVRSTLKFLPRDWDLPAGKSL